MFSVAIELGSVDKLHHYRPMSVAPGLRGYAGDDSQLRVDVTTDNAVSITGAMIRRCPTGRDLYLERRHGVEEPSWERSVLGKIVDSLLAKLHGAGLSLLEDAFETCIESGSPVDLAALEAGILEKGEEIARAHLDAWKYPGKDTALKAMSLEEFAVHVTADRDNDLIENTLAALLDLVAYETKALVAYLRRRRRSRALRDFLLGQRGQWMAEVKATLARVQSDIKLDTKDLPARVLGLSENVKPDVFYAVTLVGDVKTGSYHKHYESVATGYAIFVEYALGTRVNTTAIVAVDLDIAGGCLRSHRVVLVQPDNEQRRRWLVTRNAALGIMKEPALPQHPEDVQECNTCLYRPRCWQNGLVGGTPTHPVMPAKKGGGGAPPGSPSAPPPAKKQRPPKQAVPAPAVTPAPPPAAVETLPSQPANEPVDESPNAPERSTSDSDPDAS